MNSKITIVLLVSFSAVLLIFILWQFLFNIYEVSFNVSSVTLYADSQSKSKIEAIPLNALGFKAPFRVSPSEFELIEGIELVDVVEKLPEQGIIVLKAKDRPGKVVLKVKTMFSLWPALIEIMVRPNLA